MIDPEDVTRFLRGELTDPDAAADILIASQSDPELTLWLDLFVPVVGDDDEPPRPYGRRT